MPLTRPTLRRPVILLAASVCSALVGLSWGAEPSARTEAKGGEVQAANATRTEDHPVDEVNTKEVKISASEAKDHNLPTVEISLNTGATGLSGRKFPVEGDYLVLSGPPGGPLGLRISHIKEVPDKDDWGALVDKRYAKRSPAMGKAEEIEINGAKRSAFTFTTDSGPARAHHLLIVYEVPDSRDGLLIDFYRRAGKTETPTPKTLAADEKFAEISPSLSIRFE